MQNWLTKIAKHEYSCLMAKFPDFVAEEIKKWGKENISASDVYIDEKNKGRESQIHFTIKYGLTTNNLEVIKEFTKEFKQFDVVLGEVSRFTPPNENYDVVKIEVDGKELRELNKVISVLPNEDKHTIYKPHVTVAYVNSGSCTELSGNNEFKGKKVRISELVWSPASGNKTIIKLV